MFILIAYDINTETEAGKTRLRKVAKECQNYGIRVQNSLFECHLMPADEVLLRTKLKGIINEDTDSVRIYYLGKKERCVSIGKTTAINVSDDTLIL